MTTASPLATRSGAVVAATGDGQTDAINSQRCNRVSLLVNVATITGGTTPSIQFFVERQGADGIWYPAASSAALTAVGAVAVDVTDIVLTEFLRIRWDFAGGVNADSIKFSYLLIGRP